MTPETGRLTETATGYAVACSCGKYNTKGGDREAVLRRLDNHMSERHTG